MNHLRRSELVSGIGLLLLAALFCSSPNLWAAPRESPNLESLRDSVELLKLEQQLQAAQAALQAEALQRQIYSLSQGQYALDQVFPDATAPGLGDQRKAGIYQTDFSMPVQLQAMRSCKRLTRTIEGQLTEGGGRPLLIVTNLSALGQIQAYNRVYQAISELDDQVAKKLEHQLATASTSGAGSRQLSSGSSNENASLVRSVFQAGRSNLNTAAEIAALLRGKTVLAPPTGLGAAVTDQVLACQLADSAVHKGWTSTIASLHLGRSLPLGSPLNPKAPSLKRKTPSKPGKAASILEEKQTTDSYLNKDSHKLLNRFEHLCANCLKLRTSNGGGELSAKADAWSAFLEETDPDLGLSRLAALDMIGEWSQGSDKSYVLCAKLEFVDGSIRTYSSLFNSGSISFSAGVAVTFALVDPQQKVVASDSLYDYRGWQRLQDEGPDIPLNTRTESP